MNTRRIPTFPAHDRHAGSHRLHRMRGREAPRTRHEYRSAREPITRWCSGPDTRRAAGGCDRPMVALGDSIFHGQAASGTCFTCHGVDAKGTTLAPPLSHKWLTGDGSYAFIQQRITQGMSTPTPPYAAAMPPMGGATLTPEQIKAVAAYEYAISHP